MWIKIKPNDTLFFRSGRPFTMGDDTWADSVFPPYPSTIYGALRTFLIFERGSLKEFIEGKYKNDIGTPTPKEKGKNTAKTNIVKSNIGTPTPKGKGSLKITGPFLYNEFSNFIYFQPPLDLVKLKKVNKGNQLYPLNLIEKPKFLYSDEYAPDKILIFKGAEQVDEPNGWLDIITLKDYLEGKGCEFKFIKDKEIFKDELKTGIARERKTFTSRERYLYRIPMVRLQNKYTLLLKIEGVKNMPQKGILQLGGEGKTASYDNLATNPVEQIENIKFTLKENMFKIYFATPAIFEKGWIPEWIDENTLVGNYPKREKDGIKLKLISCVIGKYIMIGGWDIANNYPKRMYKAVPSGSVYYLKVLNGADFNKVKEVFHFKNISDINPEEGFGLSLVGVV